MNIGRPLKPGVRERKPVQIGDRYFVELLSYGQVNHFGYSLMAAKEHFKGRSDLKVLEVGVLRGHNAENINRELNPELLFLVDCWETGPNCNEYHDNNWAETFYRIQNKSNIIVVKAFSKIASKIINFAFDYIYIDGDHVNVKDDLDDWWPHMNSGGIFAGHDYNYDNIKETVDNFFDHLSLEVHVAPYHPHGGMDWWVFT